MAASAVEKLSIQKYALIPSSPTDIHRFGAAHNEAATQSIKDAQHLFLKRAAGAATDLFDKNSGYIIGRCI